MPAPTSSAASGRLTFAPWETVKTITVVIVGDIAVRAQRDVHDHAVRCVAARRSATAVGVVTIVNDDAAPPTVTVVATDASGAEAGPNTITFTITRAGDCAPAITVNLGWSGTAGAGDRTGAVAAVTFAAGQTTATITITPTDDAARRGIRDRRAHGAGRRRLPRRLAELGDGDDRRRRRATARRRSASTTSPSPRATRPTARRPPSRSRLSAASSSTITVTVGVVAGGTATGGTDYTGGTAVLLTFVAGPDDEDVLDRRARREDAPKPTRRCIVGLSGVSAGATIGDSQGVITILNDDGTPLLAPTSGVGATSALTAAEVDRALADAGASSVQPIVEDPAPSLRSAVFSDAQVASSALEAGPAPVEGHAGMIDSGGAEQPIQVVRLDLDGATGLTYRGPFTIVDVDVPAVTAPGAFAGQEAVIVASMLAMLESLFADHDVVFTIDPVPDGVEHAVVHVGGTGAAFRAYRRPDDEDDHVAGPRRHPGEARTRRSPCCSPT